MQHATQLGQLSTWVTLTLPDQFLFHTFYSIVKYYLLYKRKLSALWLMHNYGWCTIMVGAHLWLVHNYVWCAVMVGAQLWLMHNLKLHIEAYLKNYFTRSVTQYIFSLPNFIVNNGYFQTNLSVYSINIRIKHHICRHNANLSCFLASEFSSVYHTDSHVCELKAQLKA